MTKSADRFRNIHPLETWQSEKVLELLIELYEQNFSESSLHTGSAKDYINYAWQNKTSKNLETLRLECNEKMNELKRRAKLNLREANPLGLILLNEKKSFLDIGTNRLARINYLMKHYSKIDMFYGVDIIPQTKDFIDPGRGKYIQVNPDTDNYPIEPKSIDVINIQFVLHHFLNLEAIEKVLKICSELIKPDGRLYLWEETFEDSYTNEQFESALDAGIPADIDLTTKFYALTSDERWQFILVNDWLINTRYDHMPWTGQYYSWQEWLDLLAKYNFSLEKKYNFGLRVNGRLKQGVHMLGIFSHR